MHVTRKKVLLFGVKLAVLVALVAYAYRKLQLDDEYAVPLAGSPGSSQLSPGLARPRGTCTFRFSTPTGASIDLIEGSRLRLMDPIPTAKRTADAAPGLERMQATPQVAREADSRADALRARTIDDEVVLISAHHVNGPAPALDRLPGIRSTLKSLRIGWFLAAMGLFGPAIFLMIPRWCLVLRASGAQIPFWVAARLTYMAHFFNTFMPGGTGGDIVKAVYVAHYSERKAETATTVLVDRIIGLLGLLFLAGIVVLFNFGRLQGLALPIGVLSLSVCVGALLFYSQTVRKLLHYDALLARLPKADVLMRMDASLYGLRHRKGTLLAAFAVTLVPQLCEVAGVWCAGKALDLHRSEVSHYLVFVPIGYLANAVPLSFGGLGLMEGAYVKLFGDAGAATASQAFMLGVLARIASSAWGLPGALFALFPPALGKTTPPQVPAPSVPQRRLPLSTPQP